MTVGDITMTVGITYYDSVNAMTVHVGNVTITVSNVTMTMLNKDRQYYVNVASLALFMSQSVNGVTVTVCDVTMMIELRSYA